MKRKIQALVLFSLSCSGLIVSSSFYYLSGRVAQRIERQPSKLRVAGSIPAAPSIRRHYVDEISAKHGVDRKLVRAVIRQESAWNTRAVGTSGEKGLMQLMPKTARKLGVKDPFNPRQNVDGGVRLLKELLTAFNGNTYMALAGYNAGQGRWKHGEKYAKQVLQIMEREDD